jgi:hypothetical protein
MASVIPSLHTALLCEREVTNEYSTSYCYTMPAEQWASLSSVGKLIADDNINWSRRPLDRGAARLTAW